MSEGQTMRGRFYVALAFLVLVASLIGIPTVEIFSQPIPGLSPASTIRLGGIKCDGVTTTCAVDGTLTATTGGTAGLNQLTGDVTAGPAAGPAAATVVSVGGKALTLGGAFTTAGAFATTLTATATTGVTLPTTGTLATRAGAETLTTKTIDCANNTCTVRIANDVSGLGSGVATFLGTASSANLFSALTTKTGSGGSAVFATGPTLSGLILSDVATGTQCLHANSSGVVSGTGSDCGSGGGGSGTVTHTAGGLTLHAPVVGNGSADLKTLTALTNGQLAIGSTGADPVPAAITAGNGVTVTNGAGSITLNTTVADATDTNTTSYTVVAGNMGGAERLAATSGTPALILPAVSATIFQPGMSFSFAIDKTAVAYTVTNSTGLTLKNLNSTTLPPGTSGTFVANANTTDLDFYPGAQIATAGVLGSVRPDGSTITINSTTGVISSVSGGAGTVTNPANLTTNAVVVGSTNGTTDVKTLAALGASGTVLTSNGAGVPPSFQAAAGGGDFIKISTQTASTSSSLDFTSIGTYNHYEMRCQSLLPSNSDVSLVIRLSNSATFANTSYKWFRQKAIDDATPTVANQSSVSLTVTDGIYLGEGDSGGAADVVANFGKLSSASGHKKVSHVTAGFDGTNLVHTQGSGMYNGTTSAVDGIRIMPNAGTFTSGTCTLYGLNS